MGSICPASESKNIPQNLIKNIKTIEWKSKLQSKCNKLKEKYEWAKGLQ